VYRYLDYISNTLNNQLPNTDLVRLDKVTVRVLVVLNDMFIIITIIIIIIMFACASW